MKKICATFDKSLCAKITDSHPAEIIQGTFNATHIAGFAPNDGDTHGDNELIVCGCDNENDN